MSIKENGDNYVSMYKEFSRELHKRYITRKIQFYDRGDLTDSLLTLGYVETITQQEDAYNDVVVRRPNPQIKNNATISLEMVTTPPITLTPNNGKMNDDACCMLNNRHSCSIMTYPTVHATSASTVTYGRDRSSEVKCSSPTSNETLEMQLSKQMPRRSGSVIRRNKFNPVNLSIKLPTRHKFRSILEHPRRMLQSFKVIGCEGEGNGEFKHPLGKPLLSSRL